MSNEWVGREFISANELGEASGVTGKTIKRRIQAGKIKGEKVLNQYGIYEYRIPVEEARRVMSDGSPTADNERCTQDKTDSPGEKGGRTDNGQDGHDQRQQQMNNALVQWAQAREELALVKGELHAVVEERDYLRERVEYLEKSLATQNENWVTAWREIAVARAEEEKKKGFWARLFGK